MCVQYRFSNLTYYTLFYKNEIVVKKNPESCIDDIVYIIELCHLISYHREGALKLVFIGVDYLYINVAA